MSSRLLIFVIAQVIVTGLTIVLRAPDSGWHNVVFHGVLSAQFALLGIWAGVGRPPKHQRIPFSICCALALCAVAITHANFNAWELLLAPVRFPVLGAIYAAIRSRRGLVARREQGHTDVILLRLTIRQQLVVTAGVAAVLALMQLLESYAGPLYDTLLVVLVVLVGIGGSLVSVVAAGAAWSKLDMTTVVLSIVAILGLAGLMAWVGHAGTGSVVTAASWFARPLVEAFVVVISLLGIRFAGYQLVGE